THQPHTLSLHDALPICTMKRQCLARYPPNGGRLSSYLHALPLAFEDRLRERCNGLDVALCVRVQRFLGSQACNRRVDGFVKLLRSEEHTSELQSRFDLV